MYARSVGYISGAGKQEITLFRREVFYNTLI